MAHCTPLFRAVLNRIDDWNCGETRGQWVIKDRDTIRSMVDKMPCADEEWWLESPPGSVELSNIVDQMETHGLVAWVPADRRIG